MANSTPPPSTSDLAGIIASVATAIVLTVVGIYTRLSAVQARRAEKRSKNADSQEIETADHRSLQVIAGMLGECREQVKDLRDQIVADGAVYQEQLRVAIGKADEALANDEKRRQENIALGRLILKVETENKDLKARLEEITGDGR